MKPEKEICFSSEVYRIDPKDLVVLPDSKFDTPAGVDDEIVLLIGNDATNEKDSLLIGRRAIEKALHENAALVPTRVAFIPRVKKYDFVSPLVRALRYKYRTYSTSIYHVDPKDIRALKIERGMRTSENAYQLSNPKWGMPKDEAQKRYNELKESMKKGYDDNWPIDIMLCRNLGVQDNVNQGHHRMGIAMEVGLKRIAVKFSAVGCAPKILRPLFRLVAKISMVFKQ